MLECSVCGKAVKELVTINSICDEAGQAIKKLNGKWSGQPNVCHFCASNVEMYFHRTRKEPRPRPFAISQVACYVLTPEETDKYHEPRSEYENRILEHFFGTAAHRAALEHGDTDFAIFDYEGKLIGGSTDVPDASFETIAVVPLFTRGESSITVAATEIRENDDDEEFADHE